MLLLPKPEEQPHKHQREERETEKAGNTHTLLPATLFPCPAWLHSKSFQFVKESLQRHASKSFLCLRYICARSKEILQPFSLMREWKREGRGWHLLHSHPKHMQKIILHLFPISLLYYSHHTEAQAASGLPSIHFSPYGHDRESLEVFFAHWSDLRLRVRRADPRSA